VRVPASKPYEALLIPEKALATDQSVKFVYVVGSDSVAQRRAIELGAQRGDMRIVSKGLQAGEQVIVKGLQRVRPGQRVETTVEQANAAVRSAIGTTAAAGTAVTSAAGVAMAARGKEER
jgi:hypothetical protein